MGDEFLPVYLEEFCTIEKVLDVPYSRAVDLIKIL